MKTFDAYLFDLDGTLIDTTDLIYRCFCESLKEVAERFKVKVEKEKILKSIGLPLEVQINFFLKERNIPFEEVDNAAIIKKHRAFQKSIWKKYLKKFDEVEEVLKTLLQKKKRLAIVTSRRKDTALPYLKHIGLLEMFEHIVSPECTKKGKPDAEPALKALSLLSCSTNQTLFVGDSTYDYLCAKNAGLPFYLVSRKNEPLSLDEGVEEKSDYCQEDLRLLIS